MFLGIKIKTWAILGTVCICLVFMVFIALPFLLAVLLPACFPNNDYNFLVEKLDGEVILLSVAGTVASILSIYMTISDRKRYQEEKKQAEKTNEIVVKLSSSVTDLQNSVQKIETPVCDLQDSVAELQNSVKDIGKPMDSFQTNLSELQNDIKTIRASVRALSEDNHKVIEKLLESNETATFFTYQDEEPTIDYSNGWTQDDKTEILESCD